MRYPNFSEEKKLWRKGFERVVGLDEAGRGPLAGPVVAAAVSIKHLPRIRAKMLKVGDIKDSKKLAEKKRERIYEDLIEHPAVRWGVGIVSENIIDQINILEATKIAMRRAFLNLQRKYFHEYVSPFIEGKAGREWLFSPEFLIIDGRTKIDLPLPQRTITRADQKVFSCSVASIIAKVKRDRIMRGYDKEYPQYNFPQHKGYCTKFHVKALKKNGPCEIHRKSYKPIKRMLA